ncbi:MAG TPA: hypothetical protein VH092_09960, partial [Urbifossiella sp.]|nr:hypothetical protein [Urbifossiella sp.]
LVLARRGRDQPAGGTDPVTGRPVEPGVGDTAWTRRYAPGLPFSVELPGVPGPRDEAGLRAQTDPGRSDIRPTGSRDETGLRPGQAITWVTKGELHVPGRGTVTLVAGGVGIAGSDPQSPWKGVDSEFEYIFPSMRSQLRLVRRAEADGRPGHLTGRGNEVALTVQDVDVRYVLKAEGPGVTEDSPEVKRFFASVSFSVGRDGSRLPVPPRVPWGRRRLEASGFSAEMPPAPAGAPVDPPTKRVVGAPVARTEYGQMPDGVGGVWDFAASYTGTVRATDPGRPPDFDKGGLTPVMEALKAQPDPPRELLTVPMQSRMATRVVGGGKDGGPTVVRMYIAEGDRVYTLQAVGRGLTHSSLEVLRLFGTARFDDPR